MVKIIRGILGVLLSAIVAQFGSTSFEFVFRRTRSILGPHSRLVVATTDLLFAVLGAFLIALVVHLCLKMTMAQWAWIMFLIWFACGVVEYLVMSSPSVMVSKPPFWLHFSGVNCVVRGGRAACYDFFIFSVPLLRGVSYSLAILIWRRLLPKLRMRFALGVKQW